MYAENLQHKDGDNMVIEGNLSSEQLQLFNSDGYLVLESFASQEEVESMRKRMEELLDEFDFSSDASIFSTKNQQETTNDHFFESAEKISFFWEADGLPKQPLYLTEVVVRPAFILPSADLTCGILLEKAFDEDGNLKQPKELSINKVGHALHDKDAVFNKFSSSDKVSGMLRSLGYQRPVVIQSMYIFKQPGIGGEVVPHQDNSFLYTEPATCTGLWLALEDATIVNGCLWAIPGSHKNGLVRRFLRDENGVHFDKPSPCYNQKDFVPLEVKAGSLVVIQGDLIHQSFENQSSKSRHAYSLHVVDTNGCKWAEDNWIRRNVDPEPLYSC
ncbi:phytanoyl-CoA dioxygenase [Capsicum galapagoense]